MEFIRSSIQNMSATELRNAIINFSSSCTGWTFLTAMLRILDSEEPLKESLLPFPQGQEL